MYSEKIEKENITWLAIFRKIKTCSLPFRIVYCLIIFYFDAYMLCCYQSEGKLMFVTQLTPGTELYHQDKQQGLLIWPPSLKWKKTQSPKFDTRTIYLKGHVYL